MIKKFREYIAENEEQEMSGEDTRQLKKLGMIEPVYHLTIEYDRREGGSPEEIEADYNLSCRLDDGELTLSGTRANIQDFIDDYSIIHGDWEEGTDGDFYAASNDWD